VWNNYIILDLLIVAIALKKAQTWVRNLTIEDLQTKMMSDPALCEAGRDAISVSFRTDCLANETEIG
jgi:hypothetical protein